MIEQTKKQDAVEQIKKPYVAPELTQLGSVQAQTQVNVPGGSNQPSFRLS